MSQPGISRIRRASAGRRRLMAAAVVMAFVATACGSSLSHQELMSANLEAFRVAGRTADGPAAGPAAAPGPESPGALVSSGGGGTAGSSAAGPAALPGISRASGSGAPAGGRASATGAAAGTGPVAGGGSTKPSGAASASPVPGQSAQASQPGQAAPPGLPAAGGGGGPKGELRLGSIGVGSGPIGAAMKPFVDGAKAWVADVNARGGVNGHPVRLIVADDGGDPSAALSFAKRMVEQDKIQAFYATHAPTTEQAYAGYAEQKQIPIIGTCGCSNVVDTSPMIFHVGPGSPGGASWAHVLPFTALTDKRKVGLLYCREVAVCPLLADGVKKGAQPAGYQVVYEGQMSLAQPDFTAEMISARNAGADVVISISDNATVIRMIRAANRQGYKPVFSTQQSANEDSFLQNGAGDIEGVVVAGVVPDYANSPKLANYRAAMDRYVPGGRRGSFSAQAYAAGKLIEVAGTALGDDPSNTQLLDGLYALKGETLGGLVPPMTFLKGQGHGAVDQCVIPARIEGGKFVYPTGDRFVCPPGFKPAGS